jgi:hypothetical protein
MKKTVKTLALLFVSSLVMMSCGGPEDDAQEVCDLACEVMDLAKKAVDGEDVAEELEALEKEAEELEKEMEAKYGKDGDASDEDKKAFEDAVKDCDCDK